MSTGIQWTDETWNPTRGCSRVSPGCDHCYAIREARRMDHPGGAYEGLTRVRASGALDWSGQVRLVAEQLDKPLRWKRPRRVFVDSMSDLGHPSLPDTARVAVWARMALASEHTFQVLTKRPEVLESFLRVDASAPLAECPEAVVGREAQRVAREVLGEDTDEPNWGAWWTWPLPNVWLVVSAEDQATLEERVPVLLRTPAAVRGVSLEPLLGHVDVRHLLPHKFNREPHCPWCEDCIGPHPSSDGWKATREDRHGPFLDWVIVGGESGPQARRFHLEHARQVVAACRKNAVPCFVKQLGRRPVDVAEGVGQLPLRLDSPKGGDPAEWPEDLREREFPMTD